MDGKILSLSKVGESEKLSQVLNDLEDEKLGHLITSKCKEGLGELGRLLKAIFEGSLCGSADGLRRRRFIFQHCINILRQEDSSSETCREIVGTLLLEFDRTSSNLLCELVEKFVHSVREDSQGNGRVLQLLPKILSAIATRDSIPLNSDDNGNLSGKQYKSQIINNLCSTKWAPGNVIHLADMFREVPLSNEELKFVIEKIIRMFENLELEEVPPVVYQLLILCSKGHRISVLKGITYYFNQLDTNCYEDEQRNSAELLAVGKDQLRHTEGNVILHVTFAVKQDQELGKEFVKQMKVHQQSPHRILTAFNLALALSLARIHRFEEPIFDLLKAAVLKSFKDVEMRAASKWMREHAEPIPNISKEILRTVQNSLFGWDQVAQGIVQLGFILMDAFGPKNIDATYLVHSSPQQEACNLGSQILLNTFQGRDVFKTEILEQILNRLLTKTTNSSKHYVDLLRDVVSANSQALLDSLPKVKEAFEYLSFLSPLTAQGLLRALLPLLRISITLRDSLMLVLRKAMLSRDLESRKIAVSGFLMMLKHFKVHGGNITSSQSLSQSSQCSGHSSSQVQVDVHTTNKGSNSGNLALCLEILGGLRRCFTQQADIRVILYEGLYEVLCTNTELQEYLLEIIHKHFLKYYELDEEIIPPLKLDSCLTAAGDQVFLAEPLGHLLSLIQRGVVRGWKGFQSKEDIEDVDIEKQLIKNLDDILASLIERTKKCELEDFELDKSADYSLASSVGVKNNISASLVLGIIEILIEHSFINGEGSPESCEIVLQLFQKYLKLLNIVKEKSSAPGKKAKQCPSKQSVQSMVSLSTAVILLEAVFSNSLPSHQRGLEILRASGDFVQYVLNVVEQKLNQVNENGCCDGAGGKNVDHVYKQCATIGRIFLKMFNDENCLSNASSIKKEKIVTQSLRELCLLINVISKRYHAKIPSFLAAIDCRSDESDASLAATAENEMFHKHIEGFETMVVAVLSSASDTMTMKDIPSIVNMISLLSGCLGSHRTELGQIYSWVERICVEHNTDDIPVTRSLISLLLSLTAQCNTSMDVEKQIAVEIHKQLGDIDEDVDLQDDVHFAIINPRTAAPTVLIALLSQFEKILEEIEWVFVKLKYEWSTLSLDHQEDEGPLHSSLQNAACNRMIHFIQSFHELVQSAIPVGSCSEALLKTLTKFYGILGLVAKYYSFVYAQKVGRVTHAFEKMVKYSGTQLSQQVYAFLTYVQTAEQDLGNGKESGKDKSSSGTGNVRKVRAMKEMKSIPNLIYAVEQYERYLIQLSKKSKINFMEYFKRSTSRDFRINGATLEAVLKEESSEDEDLEEDLQKNQQEPPRKKGKA